MHASFVIAMAGAVASLGADAAPAPVQPQPAPPVQPAAPAPVQPQPAPPEQPQPQPPPAVPHPQPLLLGFAIGGGMFDATCPECRLFGGEAAELHAGWAFTSRFAVLAQVSAVYRPRSAGEFVTFASADVVARGWLARSVWLEGGPGYGRIVATDHAGYPIANPPFVWSATAGIGWDVYTSPDFVFDLEMRSSVLVYGDVAWDLGFLLGFTWRIDPFVRPTM